MNYRITSRRFDVDEYIYKEFDAPDDGEARRVFKEVADLDSNGWNTMILLRIDQPAIQEQVTQLDSVRKRDGEGDCNDF
jgi:hypothetical protein